MLLSKASPIEGLAQRAVCTTQSGSKIGAYLPCLWPHTNLSCRHARKPRPWVGRTSMRSTYPIQSKIRPWPRSKPEPSKHWTRSWGASLRLCRPFKLITWPALRGRHSVSAAAVAIPISVTGATLTLRKAAWLKSRCCSPTSFIHWNSRTNSAPIPHSRLQTPFCKPSWILFSQIGVAHQPCKPPRQKSLQ